METSKRKFRLTRRQGELRDLAASDATHILAYGGGRSGKTFAFCYCIAVRALSAPGSRHLIARRRQVDVRQAVLADTWPKMMSLAFPGLGWKESRRDHAITLPNGSEVWFGGLDTAERVDKILGKEFSTVYVNEASETDYQTILTLRTRLAQACRKRNQSLLKLKAYYDLNPVGRGHWTYKEFVEHVRPENGLPLEAPDDFLCLQLNPTDNPHLPAATLDLYARLPTRQRQRFFAGEYAAQVPGALWSLEQVDANRRPRPAVKDLQRIVVAVDPSGSDGTGGDSQGIVAAGLGSDGNAYVLADRSCRLSPQRWARRAADLYHELGADLLVAEANYGGAMVETTLRTIDPTLNLKTVTASRGKHVRAEPIAALYEQGRVRHVCDPGRPGEFAELEDQLGQFTTQGYAGPGSPDRADALIWALTELMLTETSHGWLDYYRELAEAVGSGA